MELLAHVDTLIVIVAIPNILDLLEFHFSLTFPVDLASVIWHPVHVQGWYITNLGDLRGGFHFGDHSSVALEQLLFDTDEKEEHIFGDLGLIRVKYLVAILEFFSVCVILDYHVLSLNAACLPEQWILCNSL